MSLAKKGENEKERKKERKIERKKERKKDTLILIKKPSCFDIQKMMVTIAVQ